MKTLDEILTIRGTKYLLRIETSHTSEDYEKYETLRNEIWGFPDDHLAGARNMMCENVMHEGGSVFIGAFVETAEGRFSLDSEHLAGFCYGFAGVRDKSVGFRDPSNLRFYSQYTAVKEKFQGANLGVRLKEFQRDRILELGITEIICTFDPLTGINARRNIHHFGMDVLEYREATYGEYGGLLNRQDVPSDRFLMAWDLEETRQRVPYDLDALLKGQQPVVRVDTCFIVGKAAEIELETAGELGFEPDLEFQLVRIPSDFYRMLLETDVKDPDIRTIPLEWRLKTRQAFKEMLARGYRVIDFRTVGRGSPQNFYILKKGTGQAA